jgi:hypothetical protein
LYLLCIQNPANVIIQNRQRGPKRRANRRQNRFEIGPKLPRKRVAMLAFSLASLPSRLPVRSQIDRKRCSKSDANRSQNQRKIDPKRLPEAAQIDPKSLPGPPRAPLGHPMGYQGIPGASWGVPRGARRDPGGTLGTPWGRLGVSPGPRRHASGPPRRPFRDPVAPKTRVVRAICCAIRFTSALGAIFGNVRAMSGRFPGRFSSAFDTAGGVVVDSLRKGPTLTKHRK